METSYSQYDEDTKILSILKTLHRAGLTTNKWCVEFGAWDGIYLSNTRRLIEYHGYAGVLIEGSQKRVEILKKNSIKFPVHIERAFVGFKGDSTLDSLLRKYPIPVDFDLLSIDVDGIDYHIFDSLQLYLPKIIVIEFNPTIPNSVPHINPLDISCQFGSSALAIEMLGKNKGYDLVDGTPRNLIFLRSDVNSKCNLPVRELSEVNPGGEDSVVLFVGFDGTLKSNKEHIHFPWHDFSVPVSEYQAIPKFFRSFSGNWSIIRRALFLIYLSINHKNHLGRRLDRFIKKHPIRKFYK